VIRRLEELGDADLDALAEVLVDCVDGGASVGFMSPLSLAHARAFWERVAVDVDQARRLVLVAEDGLGICGTVQLVLAQADNQPHRSDLAKMLVHRRARRRGLGAALVVAAEAAAIEQGRHVIVLDTVTGSDAERLYTRLGWQRVGEVPDYALMPDGTYCSTTFFHRQLPRAPA